MSQLQRSPFINFISSVRRHFHSFHRPRSSRPTLGQNRSERPIIRSSANDFPRTNGNAQTGDQSVCSLFSWLRFNNPMACMSISELYCFPAMKSQVRSIVYSRLADWQVQPLWETVAENFKCLPPTSLSTSRQVDEQSDETASTWMVCLNSNVAMLNRTQDRNWFRLLRL